MRFSCRNQKKGVPLHHNKKRKYMITNNHKRQHIDASEEFKQQQLKSIKKWGLRIGIAIALLMAVAVVYVYLG